MPWLSILMALLAYFTQSRNSPEDRRRAALVAAGAGLGTYYVSHNTDWGQENLGQFDGVVASDPASEQIAKEYNRDLTRNPTNSGWAWLKGWGGAAVGAVGGAAAASSLPSWVLPVGLGVGLILLLNH